MSVLSLGFKPPCSVGEFELKKATTLFRNPNPSWAGEVDPIGLNLDHPFIAKLLEIANSNGFRYRGQTGYTGACFLALYGSVGVHDDPGLGHVLNWVIDIQDFCGMQSAHAPQMVVRDKFIEIRVGSLFIFNANRPHSWISNQACMLVQVPVSKIKQKKQ